MTSIYNRYPLNVLRSVRFLVPEGRGKGGMLSYRVSVKPLDKDVRYAALSYVWGDPESSSTILLEGTPQSITLNLLAALEKIDRTVERDNEVDSSEPLLLWVDQLCINQDDLDERASQVSLMGAIYSGADRVYACLGDSDSAVDVAQIVTDVARRIDHDAARYGGFYEIPYLSSDELAYYNRLNWSSIRDMLLLPWFSRAWIVQESGLSRRVIVLYGERRFEWESLMTVLAWLSYAGSRIRQVHRLAGWTTHQVWVSFDTNRRDLTGAFAPYNFLDLLSHAAYRYRASNPRDYIFALFGHPSSRLLLPDGARLETSIIEPDYVSSVESVFLRFAISWLEKSGKAYLFSCVNHRDLPASPGEGSSPNGTNRLALPSWCPRWDYNPLGGTRLDIERAPKRWFAASASAEFRFRELQGHQLEVRGILYDTVVETYATLNDLAVAVDANAVPKTAICSAGEIGTALKLSYLCWSILESTRKQSLVSDQRTEDIIFTFASTANVGIWQEKDISLNRAGQLANFKASLNQARQSYKPAMSDQYELALDMLIPCCEGLDTGSVPEDPSGFLQNADNMMPSRRFFLTRCGHIGLGPEILTRGDVCCIISGANVPYILRPFNTATYLMVGECYIQDVMHGEAVESLGEKKPEWCDIVLE